jgi:hypothetical protein
LVQGLPPEAATWRVDGQQWTLHEELLAIIAERVDTWGLFQTRLRVAQKHQGLLPKEPLRIPRPGEADATKDEVITDAAEIARWFGS